METISIRHYLVVNFHRVIDTGVIGLMNKERKQRLTDVNNMLSSPGEDNKLLSFPGEDNKLLATKTYKTYTMRKGKQCKC